MQNAKDTFYEVLRERLAALNPDRTIVLRDLMRPGVLVEENELATDVATPDCFRLQWTKSAADVKGDLPMVTMQCEIAYETAGTAVNAGMDRGRMLAAMDGELLAILNEAPQKTTKMNYAGTALGKAAVVMKTNVWWGGLVFGQAEMKNDRVMRTATVEVMSYQEAGEQ